MARIAAKGASGNRSAAGKKGKARSKTKATTTSRSGDVPDDVLARVSAKLGLPVAQVSDMADAIEEVAREAHQTEEILGKYRADKSALIQVLLEIQRQNRWLSQQDLAAVCKKLGVPLSRAYRIATFYKAFSLVPRGRHSVSVCMGTACHVRGAPRLLDRVKEVIGAEPGQTTDDQKFTLETVNCLGCCALGPVVVIDDEYHSNPASKELEKIAASCD